MNIRNAKHFDLDGFHPNIGKDKSFGKKSAKSSKHDMIKYVTKDGDYIEFGIECKKYMECVKDKRAYICSKLINGEMTLVQAVEEDSKLLMTLSSLQKNLSLFQTLKGESEYKGIRKCWWIYGKPGIGKSYAVRSVYPNLYVKSSNKWWDGYTNQDAVDLTPFIGSKPKWEMTLCIVVADAMIAAAKKLKVPLRWGGAWHCADVTKTNKTAKELHEEYIRLCRSQKKAPFIDGPHYELV